MLLYQAGYDVGRYISLEKLIEESKETYYEALEKSSVGWHKGGHDLAPSLKLPLRGHPARVPRGEPPDNHPCTWRAPGQRGDQVHEGRT